MSPNEGKSPLERGKSLSRALMSYSPNGFNSDLSFMIQNLKLSINEGEIIDKWVKHIHDEGEWFYFVRSNGRGKSQEKLPDSTEVARVIDTRGEKPATDALGAICKNNDHVAIDDFRLTLRAAETGRNEKVIDLFRDEIRQDAEFVPGINDVPIVTPDRILAFSKALANLRSRFASDAFLFGSIATAAELCLAIAKASSMQGGQINLAVFHKYVTNITSKEEQNPVLILSNIVQQAINEGDIEPLISVATMCRQKVENAVGEAKSANTIDESLDKLYGAIPLCHGAHVIYAQLSKTGDPSVMGIFKNIDEILVRMIHAFQYQVQDFKGQQWKIHRDRIRNLRNEQGEEAAEKEARKLVIRDLIYPKSLLPALLMH